MQFVYCGNAPVDRLHNYLRNNADLLCILDNIDITWYDIIVTIKRRYILACKGRRNFK